jgi:prophage antirepressor-like protein
MLKKISSKRYGKNIEQFITKGGGGPFWSAKDACKVLEIEDADKVIAEIGPEGKYKTVVQEGIFKTMHRKVVVLNWMGLSSLLFRSQTPFAKRFQRFVNNYIFFDMFLHWTPYFEEQWDSDVKKNMNQS